MLAFSCYVCALTVPEAHEQGSVAHSPDVSTCVFIPHGLAVRVSHRLPAHTSTMRSTAEDTMVVPMCHPLSPEVMAMSFLTSGTRCSGRRPTLFKGAMDEQSQVLLFWLSS